MPVDSYDNLEGVLAREMLELKDLNWELEVENLEQDYLEQIDQLIEEKTVLGGVLEDQRREFER